MSDESPLLRDNVSSESLRTCAAGPHSEAVSVTVKPGSRDFQSGKRKAR